MIRLHQRHTTYFVNLICFSQFWVLCVTNDNRNLIFCLIGNSAYGRTLVQKEQYKSVSHHSSHDSATISRKVNNKMFYDITELGDQSVEIEMLRPVINLNVPVQIGFFVLEYGKLLMLKFYYDFLTKYLSDDSFCLIESDTDSLYMALCEPSFLQTVRPNKRDEYVTEHENWIAREYCDQHKSAYFDSAFSGTTWLPEKCCSEATKYFSRQPGLFHVENISRGVIALCSKSYYCFGEQPKMSAKGIKKGQNKLDQESFKNVLFNKCISQCTNRGFRKRDEGLFSYTQTRKGLNYFYGKRIVQEDGVTTFPTHL